jgi:isopenicillin N synthase-like dioxygenase
MIECCLLSKKKLKVKKKEVKKTHQMSIESTRIARGEGDYVAIFGANNNLPSLQPTSNKARWRQQKTPKPFEDRIAGLTGFC